MSLPELFGPYLLHHRLAQGTTSEVFLAQTTGDYPRLCTVKRILPELAAMPEFTARFKADAPLLVQLIHGNLVQILEVGAIEQWPFVAMEHLDGLELAELIASIPQQGPLPPELALYVGLELCEAVTYIHLRRREACGTLTFAPDTPWPLEVMLSFDGVVKIIDLGSFGALRLGQQAITRLFQCPGYAAPEVITKNPLDMRTNLFAVGLVLWELLAGRRLVADDPESYVRGVLAGTWKAPLVQRQDVAGDVIRLLASILSVNPEDRPVSVEDVRRRLVEGLRRIAPSYGSADLSQLLWKRCPAQVGRAERLVKEVIQGTRTDPNRAPVVRTRTYGSASQVRRKVEHVQPFQVGEVFPGTRYRMVRALGQGGYAEVHAAQHIDLDRQVAIKILSPKWAQDAEAIAQFRMEARACSRVGHPNIVEVTDFGELTDGRFYFAMELLEGQTLATLLQQKKSLPPEQAIVIFRQIAKALEAAHEHGIVHRDLKPDNIMLIQKAGRTDFIKVLDFGVMAFFHEARTDRVGTVGYMAPEQVKGAPPSPAMDIYSLGTVLYEMLSGELPYQSLDVHEFIDQQSQHAPPALRSRARAAQLPESLERVVHRALERNPDARHPSMADFEEDLIRAQQAAGIQTSWDDLAAPTHLRDLRARHSSAPSTGLSIKGWGALAAMTAALIIVALALWPRVTSSPKTPPRQTPASTIGEPPQPAAAVAVPAQQLPLARLLAEVDQAVAQGHFVYPPQSSALDLLSKIDAAYPENPQTLALRQSIMKVLEDSAGRLTTAGLTDLAQTLSQEARLFRLTATGTFSPRSLDGKSDSAKKDRVRPGSPPGATDRIPRLSELAWLLSQVQLAVAEGRYLQPPQNNALHFLNRLKSADPLGQRSAEAKKIMTHNLRREADALWKNSSEERAQALYKVVLFLDPEDGLARTRSRLTPREISSPEPPLTPPRKDPATTRKQIAAAKNWILEGNRWLKKGQLDAAERSFQSAIRVAPKQAEAMSGLATVAFERAQYTSAVELARATLDLDRRRIDTHLLLGDAYFKLLRIKDAQQAWQEVLQLDPQNVKAQKRLERVQGQGANSAARAPL